MSLATLQQQGLFISEHAHQVKTTVNGLTTSPGGNGSGNGTNGNITVLIANITGIGYPAAPALGGPGSSKYARQLVEKVANAVAPVVQSVVGPVVNQVAAIAGDALSCITRSRLGTCLSAAAAVLPYLVGGGEAAALTDTTAAEEEEEGGRDLVNLASDARTQHILHGDETCGGRSWPGLSGKAPRRSAASCWRVSASGSPGLGMRARFTEIRRSACVYISVTAASAWLTVAGLDLAASMSRFQAVTAPSAPTRSVNASLCRLTAAKASAAAAATSPPGRSGTTGGTVRPVCPAGRRMRSARRIPHR